MQRRGVMFTGRRHRNTQGCGRFCQTWSWKNEKPVFPPWVDKRGPSPTSRTPHTQHSHTHSTHTHTHTHTPLHDGAFVLSLLAFFYKSHPISCFWFMEAEIAP